MASAKDGYQQVAALFRRLARALDDDQPRARRARRARSSRKLDDELIATVHEVIRLTPTIVEVIVHAPAAARSFQPGQFYRLQNFETRARKIEGTSLLMEGLALTGAWVDKEKGLLSMIALEVGVSSRLVSRAPEARRARHRDGPDRRADRDPRAARKCSYWAAVSATPCSSRSRRRCAPRARR